VLSARTKLESTLQIDLAGLNPEDVGVELVFAVSDKKGRLHVRETFDYVAGPKAEDGTVTYSVSVLPDKTGMYQVGVRIYPSNAALPSRQDFPLVKWL
jgi:phosphorylase/glycogen(starch) synthase